MSWIWNLILVYDDYILPFLFHYTCLHSFKFRCTEKLSKQVGNRVFNFHFNYSCSAPKIINLMCLTCVYTEWSKSHATHIKISIDGCNSIQFDWINKHTILLWLYKIPHGSHHVVTCSRQSVSCLSTVRVQGRLFHKCKECLLSNTTWHFVLS
jgi:hypothetical protein